MNITFRNKGSPFAVSALKIALAKKTLLNPFERENRFSTYLTRETLPAEERVRKFHNHGKAPSYQTFADASMRKVVPKSCGSYFEGINEKVLLNFETGTKCHAHPREIVGPSR